jgi:hypothetical protein
VSTASSTPEQRFDLSARLPDQVFREPADLGFVFADAALLTATEGWQVLRACARQFADDEIRAVVVEDLSGTTRSTTPALTIEPERPRELLINWLAQTDVESDSPLYVDARVIAFAGSSGKWGIWLDQDRELAILGAPFDSLKAIAASTEPAFSWLPVGEVADLLAPSFYPDPVSPELIERLERAYGRPSSTQPNP